MVGIVADPKKQPEWPQIEAFLAPAAKRGGVPILEDNEEVWTFTEGEQLFGAATARLTSDGFGEVVLVGGKARERWIEQLDHLLAAWMRLEGMGSIRAYGRKGWTRELSKMGWEVMGEEQGVTAFEKVL